jgi:hypothetical protein
VSREPFESHDVSQFYAVDPWLERASDLLAEDDPGPTPFLVDELLVAEAVGAIQGMPKARKTWVELELAIAIVTGRPAFDRFAVPEAGPVIVVLEESGRSALHRRLGALTRGYAIKPAELADLHFSANNRVRLDASEWQTRLRSAVEALRPRAVFLDPLARLKAPARNENDQAEMAVLLDFMRELRNEGGCAVVFVHHTGHEGRHLRGSSDLESYWESKLSLTWDSDEGELASSHREADAGATHKYLFAWDHETRSVRLRLTEDERQEELNEKVAAHFDAHPGASGNEVFQTLGGNRAKVLAAVAHLRSEGRIPDVLVPENDER